MNEGRKEQIKLRAAFSNGIGLAFVAVGGLAPTIALISRQTDKDTIFNGAVILMAGILAGSLFHLRGIYILDEIDNPPGMRRVWRQAVLLTLVFAVLSTAFYIVTH